MHIFRRIIEDYIPALTGFLLWIYYALYNEGLFYAIFMTWYALMLYLANRKQSFDGVIELNQNDDGKKSFQLIVNKDPETFQDQDRIIFLFKDVS